MVIDADVNKINKTKNIIHMCIWCMSHDLIFQLKQYKSQNVLIFNICLLSQMTNGFYVHIL